MSVGRTRELYEIDPRNIPHEVPLGDRDFYTLFFHILRDTSIYSEARQLLKPEYFAMNTESHYRLFWATVTEFCDTYGPPHYEGLYRAIESRIQYANPPLSPVGTGMLLSPDFNGLLHYCAYMPQTALLPEMGRDLLRRFLRERTVIYPIRNLTANSTNTYANNFSELIAQANAQMQRIEAMKQPPVAAPLPPRGSPLPPDDILIPTGIPHFDNYIGGQRPGDCNGLLGVYAAGKTTQCIDLAIHNARNFYDISVINRTIPRLSVMITYEEPESKLQKRIWSNACKIPHSKLAHLRWEQLTTQATLEEYERRLESNMDNRGYIFCETERWDHAGIWLNRSFRQGNRTLIA